MSENFNFRSNVYGLNSKDLSKLNLEMKDLIHLEVEDLESRIYSCEKNSTYDKIKSYKTQEIDFFKLFVEKEILPVENFDRDHHFRSLWYSCSFFSPTRPSFLISLTVDFCINKDEIVFYGSGVSSELKNQILKRYDLGYLKFK